MRKDKKRYAHCPECGNYTRYNLKSKKSTLIEFFSRMLIHWRPKNLNKRPPCKKCGNDKQNFTHVFLETEISDEGREIAYYTPEGERIEIIK
ncbi:hypothetical protein ACFL0L_00675 [Patescibacteria group bacterium]